MIFRLLHTCFSPSWGGLEMQALEVASSLRRRKHNVWLACLCGSRLEAAAQKADMPVVALNIRGYFHPRAVASLRRFCAAEAIDLVHSHLSRDLATLAPALALVKPRIPLILSKRVGSAISKKDPLHRLTYARVDLVLAVSSVIHRNVLNTTPLPAGRVVTLHDAIDITRFSPPAKRTASPGARVTIGFVGRFSPGKGLEDLLHAAAVLKQREKPVQVRIVGEASFGEDAYADKIRSLREELGLEDTVYFMGFKENIPAVMAGFDIFAFPSHAESFGVALIEAMAMGLPVVSTNCDGVLDIVVDGETGLFVHPRNSSELAGALGRLVDDPGLRQRLGRAGRERVEELFDRERQMGRLEEIYAGLIGSRSA